MNNALCDTGKTKDSRVSNSSTEECETHPETRFNKIKNDNILQSVKENAAETLLF
ncbi:hypothetical protein LFREDSHE_19640 [Shewanella baltica]